MDKKDKINIWICLLSKDNIDILISFFVKKGFMVEPLDRDNSVYPEAKEQNPMSYLLALQLCPDDQVEELLFNKNALKNKTVYNIILDLTKKYMDDNNIKYYCIISTNSAGWDSSWDTGNMYFHHTKEKETGSPYRDSAN